MNQTKIYKVSRGFQSATIWTGDGTGKLLCETKFTPKKGLSKSQRKDAVRDALRLNGFASVNIELEP